LNEYSAIFYILSFLLLKAGPKMMISQKFALRLFARRGRISPSPLSEINSDTSTPTSGRRGKRPGRLTDFLRVRQLKQAMILNESFGKG